MRRPGNDQAEADPDIAAYRPPPVLPPVIPTVYRAGPKRLALFSTLARFGSAEDIALADLRIELMFPADEPSRTKLFQMFGGPDTPTNTWNLTGCHDR